MAEKSRVHEQTKNAKVLAIPTYDPRKFPAEVNALRVFSETVDIRGSGLLTWSGPFVHEYDWRAPSKEGDPETEHHAYVGPLIDGKVPAINDWFDEEARRGVDGLDLTPPYIVARIATLVLTRDRLEKAMETLYTSVPALKEPCDDLLEAMDHDLLEQEKYLPILRHNFCVEGQHAIHWKNPVALKALAEWRYITTWRIHETAIVQTAKKAVWDLKYPPLNITLQQIQDAGFSFTKANAVLRGLRPAVDNHEVENTFKALLERAIAFQPEDAVYNLVSRTRVFATTVSNSFETYWIAPAITAADLKHIEPMRARLVERIGDLDDRMAELFLEGGHVSPDDIYAALQRLSDAGNIGKLREAVFLRVPDPNVPRADGR